MVLNTTLYLLPPSSDRMPEAEEAVDQKEHCQPKLS